MRLKHQGIAIVIMCLLSRCTAFGQESGFIGVKSTGQDSQADSVVELTVSPAAAASRAFEHRLDIDPYEEGDGNAAIFYLQATSAIPEISIDLIDQVSDFADSPAPPSDAVRGVIHDFVAGGCFGILQEGARQSACEWQTPIRTQGISALMPELGKFRLLAKFLSAKARIECMEGRFGDAIRTLTIVFELGRDLDNGSTLIQALVGAAIVNVGANQIEFLIQQPGAPSLFWPLADLPRPVISMRRALRTERALADFTIQSLRALESLPLDSSLVGADLTRTAAKAQQELAALSVVGQSPGGTFAGGLQGAAIAAAQFPLARQFFRDKGLTDEQIDALPVSFVSLRYALAVYRTEGDDLFKWMNLPFPQAQPGLAAAGERIDQLTKNGTAQPFLLLLPAITRVAEQRALSDRRIAVLILTEAIRGHAAQQTAALPGSQADLADWPLPDDPVTGKPFEIARDGETCVIRCPVGTLSKSRPQVTEYRITLRPPSTR